MQYSSLSLFFSLAFHFSHQVSAAPQDGKWEEEEVDHSASLVQLLPHHSTTDIPTSTFMTLYLQSLSLYVIVLSIVVHV